MDLQRFVFGPQVNRESVVAVTTYEDILIIYCFSEEDESNNTKKEHSIRFYKLMQNHSSDQLSEVERWEIVDRRWNADRMCAFQCLEVQQPILVLFYPNDIDARDFKGTLLAQSRIPSKFFSPEKYRFTIWRQHYLFDAMKGFLQLQNATESNFIQDQTTLPYKIKWNEFVLPKAKSSQLFAIPDQLLMTVQDLPKHYYIPDERKRVEENKITIYVWDEESLTPSFKVSDAKFKTENPKVLNDRDIISVFGIQNKIITVIGERLVSYTNDYSEKKAIVWSVNGKYEREFSFGDDVDGHVFCWNNTLVHIDSGKSHINVVTFWNIEGEILGTYEINIPAFFVWNQHLVVFNDCIEVYRSMLL